MISTAMPPGAPSGVWIRTGSTDYLYYEEQTSAFHQAHIVASLAAHVLRAGAEGGGIGWQLVPNLDPRAGEILAAPAIGGAVSRAEAEQFAFEVLRRDGLFPGPLRARRLLKRLRPLHSVLLAAVPSAAHAAESDAPISRTARLYRAVIEIRDAALVLRPADTPGPAAAAPTRRLLPEIPDQAAKTAIEAGSLIRNVDMRPHRTWRDRWANPSSVVSHPANLCSEASRLAQGSTKFAHSQSQSRDGAHEQGFSCCRTGGR